MHLRMLQTLGFAWMVTVFFISGVLINFLQLLVLPSYWIKPDWYHQIISFLSYLVYSQITVLGEWWGEIDLKLYVENEEDLKYIGNEKAITIVNHYSDVDWLVAWVFAERVGVIGRSKVILKSGIQFVPVIGWCWWFAEYGFLRRNWEQDRAYLNNLLQTYCDMKNTFVMTLLCEGTRRTEEKLKASQDYAREKNIEPFKYHLFPRTKGFTVFIDKLREKVPALYDLQVAFPDVSNATVEQIINRGKIEVLMSLRRIPMNTLPKDTENLPDYCIDLYREKDKQHEYYVNNKRFAGKLIPLPRLRFNLYCFLFWNIFVCFALLAWTNYCAHVFGWTFVFYSFSFTILVLYVLTVFLQRYTQTKKGSKFGLKKQ